MVECTQSVIIVKLKFYVLHVLFTIFRCVLLKEKCVYARNLHLWPQFDPLGILRHISVFKPCRLSR